MILSFISFVWTGNDIQKKDLSKALYRVLKNETDRVFLFLGNKNIYNIKIITGRPPIHSNYHLNHHL